ncbi:hypothetical protein SODALDRAFT_93561 [Sodiomyces alkalinus F11]|uniref:SWIM-type domain-containing protein n=1 Tax=Sodiomyces alkalinus (strain CBS 110278 / VKM F-3762 / F11) TaxID=1314773 RepID=A0A3N2Q0V4_SODAK|nr:hypothetical protein SODALDRAFT_93561 [Sodiomyces alkalinus F11]ROT40318.1 hypothetical protein SODALDRAFT_93561 [Sodiomyces alkalinus F11]
MTTLPTPRTILTSLINSIGTSSVSEEEVSTDQHTSQSLPKLFRPSHRALLTTLHVLFPTLLLPALDLLDHSLVTRIIPQEPSSAVHTTPTDIKTANPTPSSPEKPQAAFYLVRSAASVHPRRNAHRHPHPAVTTPYLVRLDAWNCSCANFAFDAFPASASASASAPVPDEILPPTWSDVAGSGVRQPTEGGTDGEWSFGGMALDPPGGRPDDVPCCKHLLACLLAERCGDVMGRYAVERRAGREEMAGLVAAT